MTAPTTTSRNAGLAEIQEILQDQHSRKFDFIAPANTLRMKNGALIVKGTEPELSEDGVTLTDGQYQPTAIFDEGISDKLGIPLTYVRRLRNDRPDLYDANVNGLLHGRQIVKATGTETVHPADERSFMVRCFRPADDRPGVARAFLSSRYGIVDNFDYLVALLDGIKEADVENPDVSIDLTDRRMVVKVAVPELWVEAENFLRGYRSPFTGRSGLDSKKIFAGLVGSNSEVGNGAWMLTPRIVVEACTNGLTQTHDVVRGVHLTSNQDDGIIQWTQDTQRKELALVTAKTRDAVATFLNKEYVKHAIDRMERKAGVELADPQGTIEQVASKLKYSKEHTAGIFAHFIKSGQISAGGVLQAITAYSQTVTDADAAFDLDNSAVHAMELAAQYAR